MALFDLRGQRGEVRPARFTARHARNLGPERELGAAAPGELGEWNGERRIAGETRRREGGEPPAFVGRQSTLENRDGPLVVGFGERANGPA